MLQQIHQYDVAPQELGYLELSCLHHQKNAAACYQFLGSIEAHVLQTASESSEFSELVVPTLEVGHEWLVLGEVGAVDVLVTEVLEGSVFQMLMMAVL